MRQKLKHDDALSAAERKKVASRRGPFVIPHAETRLRRCPCTIRRMQPAVDFVIPSGLDQVRNSIVAYADAVVAIGGGAGKMSEVCLAWIYKRLVVALRVPGWSGESRTSASMIGFVTLTSLTIGCWMRVLSRGRACGARSCRAVYPTARNDSSPRCPLISHQGVPGPAAADHEPDA